MSRDVGRSENPGVPVLFGGLLLPSLVEIRLTDLPKSGGAMALLGTTPLLHIQILFYHGLSEVASCRIFRMHLVPTLLIT